MKRGDGAKARMSRMQGRKERSCDYCGDDVGLTTCGICGSMLCRDCKIDHPCLDGEDTRKGKEK